MRFGIDLVYPLRCAACQDDLPSDDDPATGREPHRRIFLCADCQQRLAPPVEHWCPTCSAPLPLASESSNLCALCRGRKFAWKRAIALGGYRAELRHAILRIKRPFGEAVAVALGRLLIERRGAELAGFASDVVVPVPMHWLRRWRRGGNAPDLIGMAIAEGLGLKWRRRALARRRLTPLQANSSWAQRQHNQTGSLRAPLPRRLQGRRVLLVDDVLTTGATAHAAAKVLLKAGASEVNVAVLARAGLRDV